MTGSHVYSSLNYEVGDQERVMMHACGPHDLSRLSRVLLHVYERCHRLMPKADFSPHE